MQLNNFDDFCAILLDSGFSTGGGKAKGIYSIIPYSWEDQEFFDSPVKWHTGIDDTDPWQWRVRVLRERDDIAYAKVFFNAAGYITKKWYPYFLSVRRGGTDFETAYENGTQNRISKRIYDIVRDNPGIAFHEIKQAGFFSREENSAFERAIVGLQMKMYITISGFVQKRNKLGEPYGWSSSCFMTVEDFWKTRGVRLSKPDADKAYDRIKKQILKLNPAAADKKADKFIRGQ